MQAVYCLRCGWQKHYSASVTKRDAVLSHVGERVRVRRDVLGLTQRALAARAGLSVRFLAQLERGDGNISLTRFADVAGALGVEPAALLAGAPAAGHARPPVIALLGVRGAGKSTIGARLAVKLGVTFVELDAAIERAAGLTLAQLFELHGESYYRGLEREVLTRLLAESSGAVIATGGSLVTDRATFRLLTERAHTVWLRATPRDHWSRVVEQGDRRPMAKNPRAFAELEALLRARAPLYRTARQTVDTSRTPIAAAVAAIAAAV